MEEIEKEYVYDLISQSIFYGNLGYFIGAGFSKAVVKKRHTNPALSWGELISKSAEKLEIDYTKIKKEGFSYPEIATAVCESYVRENGIDYETSKQYLKDKVCELTSWLPTEENRMKYAKLFSIAQPSWIITTNYDRVLEAILVGRGFSLGPDEYLISKQGMIPIFHMHGIRENPSSIILTQDDYVKLFRPNEYRQIKLALSIKESTTVILGYSLGDMNVLSALDWSKNFYGGMKTTYPHEIIQVLRTHAPKDYGYRDKNGIIILEVKEIEAFFEELCSFHTKKIEERDVLESELVELGELFTKDNNEFVKKFIDEKETRLSVLQLLSKFEEEVITSFMILLSNSLDCVWEEASKRLAFTHYATYLEILLDIITEIDYSVTPPVLFGKMAHSLNKVLSNVGYLPGQSYAAANIWDERKLTISEKYIQELENYADRTDLYNLEMELEKLKKVTAE